jgi:hypothetical protein
METDKPAEAEAKAGDAAEGAAEGSEAAKKEAPKVEPSSYSLANPCRVTPGQAKHVAFKSDSRWGGGCRGPALAVVVSVSAGMVLHGSLLRACILGQRRPVPVLG